MSVSELYSMHVIGWNSKGKHMHGILMYDMLCQHNYMNFRFSHQRVSDAEFKSSFQYRNNTDSLGESKWKKKDILIFIPSNVDADRFLAL